MSVLTQSLIPPARLLRRLLDSTPLWKIWINRTPDCLPVSAVSVKWMNEMHSGREKKNHPINQTQFICKAPWNVVLLLRDWAAFCTRMRGYWGSFSCIGILKCMKSLAVHLWHKEKKKPLSLPQALSYSGNADVKIVSWIYRRPIGNQHACGVNRKLMTVIAINIVHGSS